MPTKDKPFYCDRCCFPRAYGDTDKQRAIEVAARTTISGKAHKWRLYVLLYPRLLQPGGLEMMICVSQMCHKIACVTQNGTYDT